MLEYFRGFFNSSKRKAKILCIIKDKEHKGVPRKTVVQFENGERKTLNGDFGREGDKIYI